MCLSSGPQVFEVDKKEALMAEIKNLDSELRGLDVQIEELKKLKTKKLNTRDQLRIEFKVEINQPMGAKHPDIYEE